MKTQYLMAIDVGGGSGRCLLLNPETGAIKTAKRNWTHPVAPGTSGLGYSVDANDILKKLGDVSREVLAKAGATPNQIAGIAVSGMRNTIVVLDAQGDILLATPNRDARALGEGMVLGAERGKEVHTVTGHWPTPLFLGTRLLWMKNNTPALFKRASVALSITDWITFLLSGKMASECSQAGESLLFDLKRSQWAFDLIDSLGFPRSLFPIPVESGTHLGMLTKQAADLLGLIPGIPVAAGGADTQCGLLGAGAVKDGDLAVIAGTTMPLQLVTDQLTLDESGRLWSGQHVVPGKFILESNGMVTGDVIDWFARLLYPDSPDATLSLFTEAATSLPGAANVYSTFGSAIFDGRGVGLPIGNLTLSHMITGDASKSRRHIARALVEGIAFSVRANLEQIISISGKKIPTIRVAGGMSKSSLFNQIISDVTECTVLVPSDIEVTSVGAAVLAGVGAGIFTDPSSGAKKIAKALNEHRPDAIAAKYQNLYTGWRQAFDKRVETDTHVGNLLTAALFEPSPTACRAADPSFSPNIFITASMDQTAINEFEEIGHVVYAGWREKMKIYDGGADLIEALSGVQIFVTEMDVMDFPAIRDARDLRAIVTCRGNAVNIDLSAATAYGVPVINTPGRNADAVADLTVAFMVMLARKMPGSFDFLKHGQIKSGDMAKMGEAYLKYQGRELWRKTVGLVGMGNVGACVAARLSRFGTRVIFYDPMITAEAGSLLSAQKVSLAELLAISDFVSLHAPAIESTRGMMNREAFNQMKPGAFFINTARASLVDETALLWALTSGKIAGAGLDVFSTEPPGTDDPIVSHPNVIATPHLGGNTTEIAAHQGAIAIDQIKKLLAGERPDYILNPEVLDTFSWLGPRPELDEKKLEELSKNKRPSMTS
ncbi:MAG TPA: NAD(P)-dependent oxidoreductase [Smithellaceae bacterium]|nr:NAD(P)-dependent oxidoreductase [Smithellaceae bacterium]HPE06564.1 NAD(P)-dependent oxidoreductase [Smithellaceae bacterium]